VLLQCLQMNKVAITGNTDEMGLFESPFGPLAGRQILHPLRRFPGMTLAVQVLL
jgi:hypothetical protein